MAVISDPRLWELRMHDSTLYSTLINATCLPCGFCLRPQFECLPMRPLAAISKHQPTQGSFNLWTGKYADGVVEAPTPRVSLRLAVVNTSGQANSQRKVCQPRSSWRHWYLRSTTEMSHCCVCRPQMQRTVHGFGRTAWFCI